MAGQTTDHGHAIAMSDLAGVTIPEPISLSNPQIVAFQDFNGSAISLNGVNDSSTGGHHGRTQEHRWFCERSRPPGVTATTDTATVE